MPGNFLWIVPEPAKIDFGPTQRSSPFWVEVWLCGYSNLGESRYSVAIDFGSGLRLGYVQMKTILVTLSAVAALTGSASAADMGRPYTKAPMEVAAAYNWTGFYIFGGVGGGLWAADSNVQSTGVI